MPDTSTFVSSPTRTVESDAWLGSGASFAPRSSNLCLG